MQLDFGGFLGNEDIKDNLKTAFENNRLPHAIILAGEDGLGKRTLARLIARAAVCLGEHKPCGICGPCIRAIAGSHPDIRVEEGSGVSGNISVDAVKSITQDIYRKPEEAKLNIFLLFVKSRLSEPSQNKLLKVIEEPPGNALFIITTSSAQALLPTIRSRAQCLTMQPVKLDEAANYLAEKSGTELKQARKLAEIYSGNLGKMLQGLSPAAEIAEKAAEIFSLGDGDALLALTAPLIKDRDMFRDFAARLMCIFRDACVYSQGYGANHKTDLSSYSRFMGTNHSAAEKMALSHRKGTLLALTGLCGEFEAMAGRNLNMSLLVTAFCAKLREISQYCGM